MVFIPGLKEKLSREKIYLEVEYCDKEFAKSMGAMWDFTEKSWFVYDDNKQLEKILNTFQRSIHERPAGIPVFVDKNWCLPGEDRYFLGNNLFIDMVPSSCWFTNARSATSKKHWKYLSAAIASRSENTCECCKNTFERKELECHERWYFDESKKTQKLKRLISICNQCHEATHFGFAGVKGRGEHAKQHLMRINGWDNATVDFHVKSSFLLWEMRSSIQWSLDLSIISNAGILINEPNDAAYRKQTADKKWIEKRQEEDSEDEHDSLENADITQYLSHILRNI